MSFKWRQSLKTPDLQIFAENMLIFPFSSKIVGICDFDGVFVSWKEMTIMITHTDVFKSIAPIFLDKEQKQISSGGNNPPIPNFDSLPYPYTRVGWWQLFR